MHWKIQEPTARGSYKLLAKNRGHLSNKKRNNNKGVRYVKHVKIHEFNMTLKQIPYDLLEAVGRTNSWFGKQK